MRIPIPQPLIKRPAINMDTLTAPAQRAAPMICRIAPIDMVLLRDKRSAIKALVIVPTAAPAAFKPGLFLSHPVDKAGT